MGIVDVEREAAWILRSIGIDPEEVASPRYIAQCYSRRPVLEVPASEVWGRGEVEPLASGGYQILIREGLGPVDRAWTLCHETAEIHLARIGYRAEHFLDKEVVADGIAANLLMPRRRFLIAAVAEREDIPTLAYAFRVSETAVALRLGEAGAVPLAVIGPRVRVRGPAWHWPATESEMRALAAVDHPAYRRAPLNGGARVALFGLGTG